MYSLSFIRYFMLFISYILRIFFCELGNSIFILKETEAQKSDLPKVTWLVSGKTKIQTSNSNILKCLLLPHSIGLPSSGKVGCRIKMSLILRSGRNPVQKEGKFFLVHKNRFGQQQGQLEDKWHSLHDRPGRLSRELGGLAKKKRERQEEKQKIVKYLWRGKYIANGARQFVINS